MVKLPKNHFKRVISSVLACAMSATILPYFPVNAEETVEKYPYTMFAASNEAGAISVNAGNFCVNGSVATNGTIVSSGNMNINGTRTEQANVEMLYIFDKIDAKYFTGSNVEEYTEDYSLEEMNININNPVEVEGDATLTGNININSALKAFENVELYGEVKNTNESVIYSKYGDIIIDSQNVNLNGLVYAPFGNVVITAQNLNLNNVVIIADTITFECPSVNANYSSSVAEFAGSVSDPLNIPYEEWQYMKDENEDDFPDFFEDINNWEFLNDTDGDKLPDCVEIYLGSDSTLVDTDGDSLPDGYEVLYTFTNPTGFDSYCTGISDGVYDIDHDTLTNYEEYLNGTNPYNSDTDSDTLLDGDEVNLYYTNPLLADTDEDGLDDASELELSKNPLTADIIAGETFTKTFTPDIFGISCDESYYPELTLTADADGITSFDMSVYETDQNINFLMPGYLGCAFNFTTEGTFVSATLKFTFSASNYDDETFVPAIYYYNEEEQRMEELENQVINGNTISAPLEHFSVYMLMNKTAFDAKYNESTQMYKYLPLEDDEYSEVVTDADIVFVLDDSGSMSQNDPSNDRKASILSFIDLLSVEDRIGAVKFSTYATTLFNLNYATEDNKDVFTTQLSQLTDWGGTDGTTGLYSALNMLNDDNRAKCIIFLTDGVDTSNKYSYDNIIESANSQGITIFTIGLGSGVNQSLLEKIADKTYGKYFSISDTSELYNCYLKIKELAIDYITDSNNDGISDYDTWKMCTGQYNDGFGKTVFPFGSPLEMSEGSTFLDDAKTLYELVQSDDDFDDDGLKNGEEVSVYRGVYNIQYAYVKWFSNPAEKDTDDDDYNDYDEINSFGSNPAAATLLLNENQLDHLANTEYIASVYKNQVQEGNILNKIGLFFGNNVYSLQREDELYIRELLDILEAMENGKIEEIEFEKSQDTIVNSIAILEGIYTSEIIQNSFQDIYVIEYFEAKELYQALTAEREAFKNAKTLTALKQSYNAFLESNDYYKIMATINEKWNLQANFSASVKDVSPYAIADYAFRVLFIADAAMETYWTYNSIYCIGILFEDSIDILTTVKQNTDDQKLVNAINTLLPYIQSQEECLFADFWKAVEETGWQLSYNCLHISISMAGPVGVAIESVIALGNINGVSKASESAVRTCCAASTADAMAIAYDNYVRSESPSGTRLLFPSWSYECDDVNYIKNYYYYLLYSRREANECFRELQTAAFISLPHKDLIELCDTNTKWLSDDYLQQNYLEINYKSLSELNAE